MATNGLLHPGISVHHIQVGGGIAGAVFAIGSMLIFLLGVPALWVFLGGATALGVGYAAALQFAHRND